MKHLKTFEDKTLEEIKEHSVVILKDGRIGTIVHIYPDKENFEIEVLERENHEVDTINKSQIERVLW